VEAWRAVGWMSWRAEERWTRVAQVAQVALPVLRAPPEPGRRAARDELGAAPPPWDAVPTRVALPFRWSQTILPKQEKSAQG
jgi:hypothetical protein